MRITIFIAAWVMAAQGYAAFDAASLCLPHGIVVIRLLDKHGNTVSVLPNPTVDEADLVLVRPLKGIGSLRVCNAIGEAVLRIAVPPDMPRMSFNTAGLSPGIYQYTLSSGAEAVGSGKLTIIR